MDVRKLQKIAVGALEDIKARDIEVINTTKLSSLFDRIIIASADSARQTKSLARSVQDKVLAAGGRIIGMEGEESGEWIVLDLADNVLHIHHPAVRTNYTQEQLSAARPAARKKPAAAGC